MPTMPPVIGPEAGPEALEASAGQALFDTAMVDAGEGVRELAGDVRGLVVSALGRIKELGHSLAVGAESLKEGAGDTMDSIKEDPKKALKAALGIGAVAGGGAAALPAIASGNHYPEATPSIPNSPQGSGKSNYFPHNGSVKYQVEVNGEKIDPEMMRPTGVLSKVAISFNPRRSAFKMGTTRVKNRAVDGCVKDGDPKASGDGKLEPQIIKVRRVRKEGGGTRLIITPRKQRYDATCESEADARSRLGSTTSIGGKEVKSTQHLPYIPYKPFQ